MRPPRILFVIAFALCVTMAFAQDEIAPPPASSSHDPITITSLPGFDLLPHHALPHLKRDRSRGEPLAFLDSPDQVCLILHTTMVAENDHTGVTRVVRESDCTQATRFQFKSATATAK